jgi:hypothetical protein
MSPLPKCPSNLRFLDLEGWADLGGLNIFIYLFIFSRSVPKHKIPPNGTYHWLPGLIFGATCTFFQAGAVPGAPGARRGPRGVENRPETQGADLLGATQ